MYVYVVHKIIHTPPLSRTITCKYKSQSKCYLKGFTVTKPKQYGNFLFGLDYIYIYIYPAPTVLYSLLTIVELD